MFDGLNPPYATIVADPPWGYEEATPPWRSTSMSSFSLMATEDIATLPVGDLATPDAHLYLWTVLPMMAVAYRVVERWGFTADTLLTWCKPGPGLGAGFRGNTEHLIVARRGSRYVNPTCAACGGRARGARKCGCHHPAWMHDGRPCAQPIRPFLTTLDGTWRETPRTCHSTKPSSFGDDIERMSPGPYVELFARQPRLGWDSWGYGYE